jgi:unsaturated chondroitin disaccharide hydrolase
VCGLQELLLSRPGDPVLSAARDQMLRGLCTPEFLDSREECPGILRLAEVGDGVGKAKNAYTSWGDYYLMEALDRQLGHGPTFW